MRMKIPGKNEHWLANWFYDNSEWRRFVRWELFKSGGIHLLRSVKMLIFPVNSRVIKISQGTVLIGEKLHPFHAGNRVFQTADIYEAGPMHILEICYKEKEIYGVIRIPVPKGRLKEAVMLEKQLRN